MDVGDRLQNVHNEKILQITNIDTIEHTNGKPTNFYTLSNGTEWEESRLLKHWIPIERAKSKVTKNG